MTFVLDKLAIGSYEEAIKPPPKISALLNVAVERDVDNTTLVYHKVPIVDMTPIPAEQQQLSCLSGDDNGEGSLVSTIFRTGFTFGLPLFDFLRNTLDRPTA